MTKDERTALIAETAKLCTDVMSAGVHAVIRSFDDKESNIDDVAIFSSEIIGQMVDKLIAMFEGCPESTSLDNARHAVVLLGATIMGNAASTAPEKEPTDA